MSSLKANTNGLKITDEEEFSASQNNKPASLRIQGNKSENKQENFNYLMENRSAEINMASISSIDNKKNNNRNLNNKAWDDIYINRLLCSYNVDNILANSQESQQIQNIIALKKMSHSDISYNVNNRLIYLEIMLKEKSEKLHKLEKNAEIESKQFSYIQKSK